MKTIKLSSSIFQIALIAAVMAALSGILFIPVAITRTDILLTGGVVFVFVFITVYLSARFLVRKYYYLQLRELHHAIRQFSLRQKGSNTIPKKVGDIYLIKDIMRLVSELETSDKAEIVHLKELEVFRKEFLGNVSHELKTPIFTIQGYVHTLLDGGIDDNEINILYLQKAARSIDRLISIVDDLESISKLEAGELILENRTFDIEDLIQDVIESLELKAKESAVTIALEKSTGNTHYVYADKERIRQVLVNLLVNSIKYGKNGGHTQVNVEDHPDTITVEIIDNGIGIEKQHLGRLFERFYRVDKSRSREQGGTGLGLAIVKHIIEAHEQKITVDSTPGVGTTFTFTLKKSH